MLLWVIPSIKIPAHERDSSMSAPVTFSCLQSFRALRPDRDTLTYAAITACTALHAHAQGPHCESLARQTASEAKPCKHHLTGTCITQQHAYAMTYGFLLKTVPRFSNAPAMLTACVVLWTSVQVIYSGYRVQVIIHRPFVIL